MGAVKSSRSRKYHQRIQTYETALREKDQIIERFTRAAGRRSPNIQRVVGRRVLSDYEFIAGTPERGLIAGTTEHEGFILRSQIREVLQELEKMPKERVFKQTVERDPLLRGWVFQTELTLLEPRRD